ncbi:MAG: glycosidase [Microbacterium sp.]|nr:glycosidase [Microbacterium sp.]MBN9193239.1 glycosidase [Microbacterium sp.]OJU68115.1 MAG: glycosidase [Microbacterium sp. 70-38]
MHAPAVATTAIPYALRRSGVLMSPEPGNDAEAEGVINPAAARDDSGEVRLFPRMVATGNFSRIGDARVVVEDGVPTGVERRGVALQPDRIWERGSGHGGTEDPRITWIAELGLHVMTYVAFGPTGPRPAIAVSADLATWRRLGPIQFDYEDALGADLNVYPNKDVVFFPEPIPGPDGVPSFAALHRPMWDLSFVRPDDSAPVPPSVEDPRPSIWISYVPVADVLADIARIVRLGGHRVVAAPAFAWEELKIGAGPAPLRVPEGWLLLHHGVSGRVEGSAFVPQRHVRYCVGAMILDPADPSRVLARSEHPLLEPETADETDGVVANVVFPTAIEEIDGVSYVFYGMADYRIGVAVLERTAQAGEDAAWSR